MGQPGLPSCSMKSIRCLLSDVRSKEEKCVGRAGVDQCQQVWSSRLESCTLEVQKPCKDVPHTLPLGGRPEMLAESSRARRIRGKTSWFAVSKGIQLSHY